MELIESFVKNKTTIKLTITIFLKYCWKWR